MAQIIVTIITAVATIVGVILANNKVNAEMNAKLDKQQAITETKLDSLAEEVRKHNNFAQRIPVMEMQLNEISKLDKRVTQIEGVLLQKGERLS